MTSETDEGLGLKLSECRVDKSRLAVQVGWRLALCIVVCIGNFGGFSAIRQWGEVPPTMAAITANIIITVGFGLFPLIHAGDYLAFYQNGIVFKKKRYLWSELGKVGWRDFTHGGVFHSVMMDTSKKVFNVTYLEHPKKHYNEAYMKN